MDRSQLILQDDSGVPYRMFDESWKLDLYGNYTRPVALKGMLDPYDNLRAACPGHRIRKAKRRSAAISLQLWHFAKWHEGIHVNDCAKEVVLAFYRPPG